MIIYCKSQALPSLETLKKYYNLMKHGETLLVFFNVFDISILHDNLEEAKFKQLRLCECLSESQEDLYFLTSVKKSKPTFNSRYDNGIYETSLHQLIHELIKKHTNVDETVHFIF